MKQTECHSNPTRISDIIDENELVYASRVLWLMRDMNHDEVRKLDPGSPNYNRFVSMCKGLMDIKLPQSFGFEMEFNPNYTALKKLHPRL